MQQNQTMQLIQLRSMHPVLSYSNQNIQVVDHLYNAQKEKVNMFKRRRGMDRLVFFENLNATVQRTWQYLSIGT